MTLSSQWPRRPAERHFHRKNNAVLSARSTRVIGYLTSSRRKKALRTHAGHGDPNVFEINRKKNAKRDEKKRQQKPIRMSLRIGVRSPWWTENFPQPRWQSRDVYYDTIEILIVLTSLKKNTDVKVTNLTIRIHSQKSSIQNKRSIIPPTRSDQSEITKPTTIRKRPRITATMT